MVNLIIGKVWPHMSFRS